MLKHLSSFKRSLPAVNTDFLNLKDGLSLDAEYLYDI
jgi:hypothetical protein